MYHQSVEDGLDSLNSETDQSDLPVSVSNPLHGPHHPVNPAPGTYADGPYGLVSDLTDYSASESEAEENRGQHSVRRNKLHLPYDPSPNSRYSSISSVNQTIDRQLSRWSHQSQTSLLYNSNQQLADVPEEFQEELSASIVGQHRDRFTLYRVLVQFRQKTWFVLRRYSDFALLNKKLQKQFSLFHFEIPPRRIDRSKFNHAFIDDRQQALDGYLKNLLVHQEFAHCSHVKRFLKLDDPPKLQADPESVKLFCHQLHQQNDFLHHQLQAAKVEIIALRGGVVPEGPVEIRPSMYASSSNLGQRDQIKDYIDALNRTKEEAEKAQGELNHLKREMKAEQKATKEAGQELLKRKETLIKEQMENFDKLHTNLDDKVNALTFGEDNGLAAKTEDLKQTIHDWEELLRDHHQKLVETFEKQISDLRLNLVKKSEISKVKDEEIKHQKEEREQNKQWLFEDIRKKEDRIKTLNEQVKSAEKRCSYAEEQYFYALCAGVKMSIIMTEGSKASVNGIHSQELYEKVTNEGLPIKHWASWISREVR